MVLAMLGTFAYVWYFIDVSEAAIIRSGSGEILTEAETQSQFGRQNAVVTRCLVPLAGSAPVTFANGSHEPSRQQLLEEAFDKGMYHFRWGYSCGVP